MLAAAPNGWGSGNSAEAYEQWFEPVGEDVALRHLLSSHLTWLVEFGWPLRWLYLFLWMAVIALMFPGQTFNFPIWGIAVWTAFMVALFYNAAGEWWNWPLPVLWLIAALAFRFRKRTFPGIYYWIFSALVSGILAGLPFVVFGLKPSEQQVRGCDGGNVVLIGVGKPTVAILGPSKEVLGTFYGQEIRKELSKVAQGADSVVVMARPNSKVNNYLADCRIYVISGADNTALKEWELLFTPKSKSNLLLINCRVEPDDWIRAFGRVVYCHGEFYGDPFYSEWHDFSTTNPAVSVKDIPRHAAYIADWWPLLDDSPSQ